MTIAKGATSLDVGYRDASTYTDEPRPWYTAGVSMSGNASSHNFGVTENIVTCTFPYMLKATKNSLRSLLIDTVGPYGYVTVTPDAGDDLGCNITTATEMIFVSFTAEWVMYDYYKVTVILKYMDN